jgi:hypothetical protein
VKYDQVVVRIELSEHVPCLYVHFSRIGLQWKTTRPTDIPTDADGTYHPTAAIAAKSRSQPRSSSACRHASR